MDQYNRRAGEIDRRSTTRPTHSSSPRCTTCPSAKDSAGSTTASSAKSSADGAWPGSRSIRAAPRSRCSATIRCRSSMSSDAAHWSTPTTTGARRSRASQFDPGVDRFLKAGEPVSRPAERVRQRHALQPQGARILGAERKRQPGEDVPPHRAFSHGLRAEGFNIFNRTVFSSGNTNLNSASFGVVNNQVNDPRQLQMGLKVYW